MVIRREVLSAKKLRNSLSLLLHSLASGFAIAVLLLLRKNLSLEASIESRLIRIKSQVYAGQWAPLDDDEDE